MDNKDRAIIWRRLSYRSVGQRRLNFGGELARWPGGPSNQTVPLVSDQSNSSPVSASKLPHPIRLLLPLALKAERLELVLHRLVRAMKLQCDADSMPVNVRKFTTQRSFLLEMRSSCDVRCKLTPPRGLASRRPRVYLRARTDSPEQGAGSDVTGLREVTLDDKYTRAEGPVFMTGIQALVRLPMMQRRPRRGRRAEHRPGYITRLPGLAARRLRPAAASGRRRCSTQHHIVHQPGVNEDLAATACQGTQQVGLQGRASYDGVFADLVRQGAGRRPLRRRHPPRQPLRHAPPGRRARCCSATTISARARPRRTRASTPWSTPWCRS